MKKINRLWIKDNQAIPITERPSPCTGTHRINGDLVDVTDFLVGEYEGEEYRYWVGSIIPKLISEMVEE